MTRSRFLAAALMLAGPLAACDPADSAGPAADLDLDDPLAALLADAGANADTRHAGGGGGGHPLFDRLASEIPGFGGLYRTARCSVVVVLTDEGDPEQAVRVVKAVIEPLVVRGCPAGIRVQPARGQFTYIELQRFLGEARPLLRIRGVFGIKLDYQANRLVIGVASHEVARKVLDALPHVGIPAEAVTFQPGRDHGKRDSGTGGSDG